MSDAADDQGQRAARRRAAADTIVIASIAVYSEDKAAEIAAAAAGEPFEHCRAWVAELMMAGPSRVYDARQRSTLALVGKHLIFLRYAIMPVGRPPARSPRGRTEARRVAEGPHRVPGRGRRPPRPPAAAEVVQRVPPGPLLGGHRKSVDPMAARSKAAGRGTEDCEQALRQFLSQSLWDERVLPCGLRAWIGRRFGTGGLLAIGGTGPPCRTGTPSAWPGNVPGRWVRWRVARPRPPPQFAAAARVVAPDARLYLPGAWAGGRERLVRAGVPDAVGYRPEWGMALAAVRRATTSGPSGAALAGSPSGSATEPRERLAAGGRAYCVGIDSALQVIAADADLGPAPPHPGTGRPPPRPANVRRGATSPGARGWTAGRARDSRPVAGREGATGAMASRWANRRVRPAHRLSSGRVPLAPCRLLAEWPAGAGHPTKYSFGDPPGAAGPKRLVATAEGRWWVEHGYRESKGESGLGHLAGGRGGGGTAA